MADIENIKKPKILCVDDENGILELLQFSLRDEFEVHVANSGVQALDLVEKIKPDLIVLDMMMPQMDGMQFIQVLRWNQEHVSIPVMFLTAFDELDARVKAFKMGADDFLPKPFHPDELIARIRSKLNRMVFNKESSGNQLVFKDVTVDLFETKAFLNGKDLELSLIEYKILALIMRAKGEPVPRGEVETHIWTNSKPSDRALDPHIFSLRKKLQSSGVQLSTIYGKGFVLA